MPIIAAAPSRKPTTAGTKLDAPQLSAPSIAGMSSDQTEAAVITPAAKPKKRVLSFSGRSFLKKNTSAAPAAVDMKIIEKPNIVSAVFVIDNLLTFYLLTFAAVILPRLAIIFIACAPAALFARQGLFAFYNLYS